MHGKNANSKIAKISYYKKPQELTTEQWQGELRRQFVADKKQKFTIKYLGGEQTVFGDYSVTNPTNKNAYKVALRDPKPGSNFCACMDFKTNYLGTCKHIEAVFLFVKKNKKIRKFLSDEYSPAYSSIFLKYGPRREIVLRIGTKHFDKYKKLAKQFFDKEYRLLPGAVDRVEIFLQAASRLNSGFRCYEDALNFIIKLRDDRARQTLLAKKVDNKYLDGILKASLYPFQKEGINFAVKAGRVLIADEMGLGKTLQALGAAELLKKVCGISSVLIICPTSLKYQWKSEIEKFTGSNSGVVEGDAAQRQEQYKSDDFYYITSYNVTGADSEAIKKMAPDMVILDEAQRIKNWQTKTAREIKKIESKYALVLTGTPIENKLEELYSIIQFIDPFKLGPLYKFLDEHQIRNDSGKVIGYRELNRIKDTLADIVIRRTKKQVLAQLPERVDKNLFVSMTEQQTQIHSDYADIVARLVSKWKRLGFLDEKDRQRLLLSLNCMRMVANSTYILDQETRHDTKISELMCILDNVFATNEEKVVVFSQWERMTRLVKAELENRKVCFAHLHGGVPSNKRKSLLDEFNDNLSCRVFLSTDAGGVGLNLQVASLLINLDLPWNPAVLEQRVGRIHRHGQKRNINIINLISKDSIEERMLDVLKFKSSLFAGALENGANEIFMGEDKFKRFMSSVEQMTNVPQTPATAASEAKEKQTPAEQTEQAEKNKRAETPASPLSESDDLFTNAAKFFGKLSQTLADKQKTKQLISNLTATDSATGESYLKIPLQNKQAVNQAVDALTNLLLAMFKTDK